MINVVKHCLPFHYGAKSVLLKNMKKLRSANAVALVVALGRSDSPVVVHHYLLSLRDHRSPRTSPARRVAARRVHLAGHFAGATPHPRPGRTKLFHLRRAGPDCGSCERSRPVHSDAATEAGLRTRAGPPLAAARPLPGLHRRLRVAQAVTARKSRTQGRRIVGGGASLAQIG